MKSICHVVRGYLPGFVKVVEGSTEFIKLFLCDALAVTGQDLVLNLVDGPETKNVKFLNINKLDYSKMYFFCGVICFCAISVSSRVSQPQHYLGPMRYAC